MTAEVLDPPDTSERSADGEFIDGLFARLMAAAALTVIAVLVATAVFLLIRAWPALSHYGPLSFFHARWAPSESAAASSTPNPYGIVQFIYGTVVTSLVAMVIAVPVAIGVALYITNLSPAVLRRPLSSLVDLLAAIPSVVYGLWAVFVLVPLVQDPIGPFLVKYLGWTGFFGGPNFGVGLLTASIILAIMILPIISSLTRDMMLAVPNHQREAVLALGATRWEMIRTGVLRNARIGIVGAVILGLGRALGETMAVAMTIGNHAVISKSLFAPGNTLASAIANEFSEATDDLYLSALIEIGLALFLVTIVVNAIARLLVWAVTRGAPARVA